MFLFLTKVSHLLYSFFPAPAFPGSTHHTHFIFPFKRPTPHAKFSDCAKECAKPKYWCSYVTYFYNFEFSCWASPADRTMTAFVQQSQLHGRWLQHCHNSGTTGRTGLWRNIFFYHLCRVIGTTAPAEPRLVLHGILAQHLEPAPGVHITLPLSADGPVFIWNAGKGV